MKRLQPVIWSKGTFLTPQHLQAQDRFIEAVLHFHLNALRFHPWGFQELRIDQEALVNGTFCVASAAGIFPDGLLFSIPDSDAAPPVKPLAQYFGREQRSIDVYMAIPHYRENGLNVSLGTQNADTRYVAEMVSTRDENSGTGERLIHKATKNFRLLVESESREGTSALRIARVTRTPAVRFELDPRFVSPLINISASDYLISIARRLLEVLSARSTTLAAICRRSSRGASDPAALEATNLWQLYAVNTHLPLLQHLYETSKGHPEELFDIMSSLAGALTTFSARILPSHLPLYDHHDLGACFTDLDEKIRILLEETLPTPEAQSTAEQVPVAAPEDKPAPVADRPKPTNFVCLPLSPSRPYIHTATMDEDRFFLDSMIYLGINAEISEAELSKNVPQLVKVSAATQIDRLVRQALGGVRMTHVPSLPGSLPAKPHYQYFALSQTGPAWAAVRKARNLAAYVPAGIPNPKLELMIQLPG